MCIRDSSSISAHFNRRMDGVLEVMQKAADALGDATQYTALVLPPRCLLYTSRCV